MADDPGDGEAEDERALELSTVAAIYPELETDAAPDHISATLSIAVEPIKPVLISFPPADGTPPGGLPTPPNSTDEDTNQVEEHKQGSIIAQDAHNLSYLPPLSLRIVLPEGYPTEKPPLVQLESQFSWLPKKRLLELEAAGNTVWEEVGRDQMVFSYIDHLREAAENAFGLAKEEGEVLAVPSDLKVALLDFDLKAQRAKFEQETFDCGICLEPKKGTVCHRLLLCSHVFCVPCLQVFYNTSITDGEIGNVKCMAPACGSDLKDPSMSNFHPVDKVDSDRTLEPSELLQIPLEQETVQRYIKLKRKKRLESDRSTVYCPRQWCQGPANCPNRKLPAGPQQRIAGKGNTEMQGYNRNTNMDLLPPPAERLAICEDCTFAFCKVCKAGWHGEYFVCFPRSQFELTAEEKASEDYMKLHTQPCPTCDARAQKTHGCNHMICFKCDTHFCYLCGSYLDKSNPYQHYNTKKNGCFMRLWELEGGDDGEFGQAFAGGGQDVHLDIDSDDEDGLPDVALQAPVQRPVVRNLAAAAGAQNAGPGIQRFLAMAQNDDEEGWDSDDMDGPDEGWDLFD